MFKVGISGDLLNSENKPCFGDAPLELLKVRKDIEISWMDKSIKEISSKMASQFDAILLNLPKANSETVSKKDCKLKIISNLHVFWVFIIYTPVYFHQFTNSLHPKLTFY